MQKIPLLTVKAGPRDKEEWQKRLKEVRAFLASLRSCKVTSAPAATRPPPAADRSSVPCPLPSVQELQALIKYIEINKAADLDWFTIKPSNKEGTHWSGKCWCVLLGLGGVAWLALPADSVCRLCAVPRQMPLARRCCACCSLPLGALPPWTCARPCR